MLLAIFFCNQTIVAIFYSIERKIQVRHSLLQHTLRSILKAPRISNMAVLRELDCMFLAIFRHPGTFGPIFIKDFLFLVGCGIHTPMNGMKIGELA